MMSKRLLRTQTIHLPSNNIGLNIRVTIYGAMELVLPHNWSPDRANA